MLTPDGDVFTVMESGTFRVLHISTAPISATLLDRRFQVSIQTLILSIGSKPVKRTSKNYLTTRNPMKSLESSGKNPVRNAERQSSAT